MIPLKSLVFHDGAMRPFGFPGVKSDSLGLPKGRASLRSFSFGAWDLGSCECRGEPYNKGPRA